MSFLIRIVFIVLAFTFLSSAVFSQTAEVISQKVNFREQPKKSSRVIQTLSKGTILELESSNNFDGWYFVSYKNKTGWIHGNTIKLLDTKTFNSTNDSPKLKYDAKENLIEISNMVNNADGFECKKTEPYIGTIIKRGYNEDQITISSILIKDRKDNRKYVNIDKEQISLLGRQTPSILSSAFALNQKAKVLIFECSGGGSGVFLYIDKILLIN